MTVQPITLMGNPVLMTPAHPVEDIHAPEIAALIQDMKDSMKAAGGIGIAAPQIGVPLRIVMFYAPGDDDSANGSDDSTDPDHRAGLQSSPLTVLINPEIEVLTDEMRSGWEGCLSVPGLRGIVPRYTRLRYTGTAPDGSLVDRIAEGFHAVVVQHECDHLDGILAVSRAIDGQSFALKSQKEHP